MPKQWMRVLGAFGFAAAFMCATAFAADTGGKAAPTGLPDLEERVAELEATAARKGNRKVSLIIYGQVHKGMFFTDVKGDADKGHMVDPGHDPSLVGFRGEAKISPSVKVGYTLELQIAGGTPDGIDTGKALIGIPGSPDGVNELQFGASGISVRHSYLWIEGTPGKLSLGQTSMATDGILEISTANTSVAVRPLSLSPVQFGGAATGLGMPWDGSRANLLRYDSKVMAGFMVSAAMTEDDSWDAALRYAGEFSGFRFAAGLGYRNQKQQTLLNAVNLLDLLTVDVVGSHKALTGSASAKHINSGLFATAYYSRLDYDLGVQTSFLGAPVAWASGPIGELRLTGFGGQAGIEKNWTGFGNTTLFAEYNVYQGKFESESLGAKPTVIGLGVVQTFDAAAMDIYANWRQYDLDIEGADKVNSFGVGARIRF